MTTWPLFLLAAAAAALLVWHSVSRSQEASELLLGEYRKLLTEARSRPHPAREIDVVAEAVEAGAAEDPPASQRERPEGPGAPADRGPGGRGS